MQKKKTYLNIIVSELLKRENKKNKFIKNVNLKKLRREKNKIEEDIYTYER
jgi:hypothetical protein